MKNFISTHRNETGFSITELMVAMVIGLIILAGVASIFVNANKASNNANRAARIQENGRFAMYYLVRDLRMTGFMGCNRNIATNIQNDLNTTSGFYFNTSNFATPIEAIDDVTASTTPAWQPSGNTSMPSGPSPWNNSTAAIAKPDMITIRRVDTSIQFPLAAAMTSYTDPITIPTQQASSFQLHPVIVVSDCVHSDVVQVTDTAASGTNTQLLHSTSCSSGVTPCNSTSQLSKTYDTSANIIPFTTRIYYIGLNTNNVPALYQSDNGGTPVDVVDGIESIKILYGIASGAYPSNQPTQYKQAGALSTSDWTNVVSLKIGILARTTDTLDTDTDTNTYNVNGTILGPFNDRNTRRVFTSTILLKNKMIP